MRFDRRQFDDDPRADADAEAAVKRELEALLRVHGGLEGLARKLGGGDRNAWRYERHADDNDTPKRARAVTTIFEQDQTKWRTTKSILFTQKAPYLLKSRIRPASI